MIKIPEKFKIGGHIYTVQFPYRFEERSDINGLHLRESTNIRITDCDETGCKRSVSTIYVTVIHEVLHSIDQAFCHGILANDKENGENIIKGLSEGIFAFLIDNGYLKKIEDD